ncbi:MAG: peptidoglycan DD-metalloendopeptidase family protein [Silicimonas sp.]|nr:peptidoglycan DD-metalloendopeptidase family protein [Silicimonas sp.]
MTISAFQLRLAAVLSGALALSGCNGGGFGGFDFDLRGAAGQLDTSDAARNSAGSAPQPDARGVISYPGYQVAVARRGDTVQSVAARIGLPANEIASHNALPADVVLRDGEILALPRRVNEPGNATPGALDVIDVASGAIDRAESTPGLPAGDEPARHRVAAGETAFSIARRYGVSVDALSDWNGLGPNLNLRVGQFLLIPNVPGQDEVRVAAVENPGAGSATPLPPSSARALPTKDVKPAARKPKPAPLKEKQTVASDNSRLMMPVKGKIVRPFEKGRNEGIGISATAGARVIAADKGTVAAITRDTDQVPILVLRHDNNLLTVYAGVDEVSVNKGDKVKRGEKIAVVRSATPPFLHFEVREGFDSVDPSPYLN